MLENTSDTIDTRRPTQITVDLDAIEHNVVELRKFVGDRKIMFILKANAYGHGLLAIANHLENLKADYLGVAYLEEGILLRKAGIMTPILVLGGIIGNQIPFFIKYDLTITASSIDKLKQIDATAVEMGKRAKVHLKIDTGMERIGIHYYSADQLIDVSQHVKNCDVEGVFSHFSNADIPGHQTNTIQRHRFEQVISHYDHHNRRRPPLIHFCNSSATLSMPETHYDMVRVGLLLYGIYPHEAFKNKINVKPVLSWKTRVVYFKVVLPDHPVSYGSTWSANKMTRVVTLPVGYGDGYFRAMSDRALVLIAGKKHKVVGQICMDQMMVNIEWNSAYNGDEVVLVGTQGDQHISIEDLAAWAGTIPYEILTNINTRVPRVYIRNKSVLHEKN